MQKRKKTQIDKEQEMREIKRWGERDYVRDQQRHTESRKDSESERKWERPTEQGGGGSINKTERGTKSEIEIHDNKVRDWHIQRQRETHTVSETLRNSKWCKETFAPTYIRMRCETHSQRHRETHAGVRYRDTEIQRQIQRSQGLGFQQSRFPLPFSTMYPYQLRHTMSTPVQESRPVDRGSCFVKAFSKEALFSSSVCWAARCQAGHELQLTPTESYIYLFLCWNACL